MEQICSNITTMTPPEMIFPPHIPGSCHPNVNSMIALIEDGENNDSPNTNDAALQSQQNGAQNDVKHVGKHCESFIHKSNLYSLQVERIKSDPAGYDEGSRYTKGKITELTARAKIAALNYKYCIASQICPQRMQILNSCYNKLSRQSVVDMMETGRHDYICKKEKTAVERCVARLVMSATREEASSS